mgnify:CR=1 FL=1
MNEQIDILNLLKDKTALLQYILTMIEKSDKFAKNLPELRQRGWSEQGMLDKVIEVTARLPTDGGRRLCAPHA